MSKINIQTLPNYNQKATRDIMKLMVKMLLKNSLAITQFLFKINL